MDRSLRVSYVLGLEDQRCNATVQRDVGALELLLADDLTYTHSSGRVETKAAFLESIRAGNPRYHRIERSDVVVRVFDDAVAVVTGLARFTVTLNGQDKVTHARFTNVWTRGEDANRWRFSAWQSTPCIAPDAHALPVSRNPP
jgi:hypothetical protein